MRKKLQGLWFREQRDGEFRKHYTTGHSAEQRLGLNPQDVYEIKLQGEKPPAEVRNQT